MVASSLPESWMLKSDKQKTLEANGCIFRGQEYLDNHEIDPTKECYCGRPNRRVNMEKKNWFVCPFCGKSGRTCTQGIKYKSGTTRLWKCKCGKHEREHVKA